MGGTFESMTLLTNPLYRAVREAAHSPDENASGAGTADHKRESR